MGLALVWCVAPKACGGLLCAAQFEQRADAATPEIEKVVTDIMRELQ